MSVVAEQAPPCARSGWIPATDVAWLEDPRSRWEDLPPDARDLAADAVA
jgi:hypothetical protein